MLVMFEAFGLFLGENYEFYCNIGNVDMYVTFEAFGQFLGKI